MNRPLTPSLALLLMVPPLAWAANAVVGRMAVGLVPPVALNMARWLVVFALLLPFGWRALKHLRARRGQWAYLSVLGLIGVGSYNALQYLALHTSTPMSVTLIAASSPVWMLAIGAVGYGVRPTRREIYGAMLSFVGVAAVVLRGDPTALATFGFVIGDLVMLVAVILWAFYSWLLARPPASARAGPQAANWVEALLVQTSFGLVWCLLGAGLEAAVSDARWQWSPWLPALLLFVAIGPSIAAYRCWAIGVESVGPATTSFFGNLTPAFAALISIALLGEAPRAYHLAGFAFIVAGIVVARSGRRAERAPSAAAAADAAPAAAAGPRSEGR